jgi:hypothetical protein
LADFREAQFDENSYDFVGFEDWNVAHDSSDGDILNTHEIGLQHGFAVFQKHCNNIVQVMVEFIQGFPLRMSAGKTGNESNEQASLWASFYDCRIDFHDCLQNRPGNAIVVLRSAMGNR